MWKSSLDKKFEVLTQKICIFCHTYYCGVSCTSSSLPFVILEYLCVMEKPHQSMVLLVLHLSAFLLTCLLSLSLLFSFSAHLLCSHGRSCLAGEWQPPAECLLTPLCCSGGCSPLFYSCFHKLLVSCLQESKVKPEGYRLRRWFPRTPPVCALWPCSHRRLYTST